MSAIDKIKSALKTKRIPYNYVIGGKETSAPIPFDVKVSFDPSAKKTIITTAALVGGGLTLLAIGIAVSKRRN
jgi:hypothetical protein